MNKKLLLFILLLIPLRLLSQPCSCLDKFKFIRHEMETNYAGYADKITTKNKRAFDKFTQEILTKVKNTRKDIYCSSYLDEWLNYFNDHHVWLRPEKDDDYFDSVHAYDRARLCETIDLNNAQLKKLPNDDTSIEGIYINRGDTMYTVAVIKNKNEFRNYVGVIIDSKTPYWHKGQVKFEIGKRNSRGYETILYNRYHVPNQYIFTVQGIGLDGYAWLKYGKQMPEKDDDTGTDDNDVDFRRLSDSTLYLQISTFSLYNARAIDSVVKANDTLLRSTPNLIIDIRGNGGGSDFSYYCLTPYLYTDPVSLDGNFIYATADNVRRVKNYLKDPDFPQDQKQSILDMADSMQHHIGHFIVHAQSGIDTEQVHYTYPRRVTILIDGYCGSSAEEFLLAARQSRKVTLMGQHTRGVLDYSNVLETESFCGCILNYSSTKSARIPKGKGIDNIGIMPDIRLTDKQDWIAAARERLEHKDTK